MANKETLRRTGKRARTAFTLVELLVVIAIIALLMSILMPALARVKKQAEDVACKSNLRQIGLINTMYLHENDFVMPYAGLRPGNHTNNCNRYFWKRPDGSWFTSREQCYWGILYHQEGLVKDKMVFGCPSFMNAADVRGLDKLYSTNVKDFRDSGYALNGWMSELQTNAVRTSADVILAQDHGEPRIENGYRDMFFDNPNNPTGQRALQHYTDGGRTALYRAIFRHRIRIYEEFRTGGTANVLLLDNSVGFKTEQEIRFDHLGRVEWYDPLRRWETNWDG